MKLTIHNVGHGSCISLVHGNDAMLWDCGRDGDNRPSRFLPQMGVTQIGLLFITNYDQDHISDLSNLLHSGMTIYSLARNKSINAASLQKLKEEDGHTITPEMESLLGMMGDYSSPVDTPFRFPGVAMERFYNSFSEFVGDTNNCSLVTFLDCQGDRFVFPGDLEKEGWLQLLKNPSFRECLRGVHYFVASHHGRENGYCEEVFDYCNPRVVILSDSRIQYGTQEDMSAKYAKHCSGTIFNGKRRYVLSTRNDGEIWREWY